VIAERQVTAGGAPVWTDYIFAGSKRVAKVQVGADLNSDWANTEFYHGDHLGSTRLMTNYTGAKIANTEVTYLPFGQQWENVTSTNHYKFTGKERDTESGLDYFGARYYASNMGRWMTPDWATSPTAVPYANFGDPQSLNLYGYVGNRSTINADADGHCECIAQALSRGWTAINGPGFVAGLQNYGRMTNALARNWARDINERAKLNPQATPRNDISPMPYSNASFSQEQGRDAQGKFLPKQDGQTQPGAAAEKAGLETVGAEKNTAPIPGSTRIPDGKIVEEDQYAEVKSGQSVSSTQQLNEMGKAAVAKTGKPLVVVTTNPNVKVSQPAKENPNLDIRPLDKK
jgi:RHS repeat-associated protein